MTVLAPMSFEENGRPIVHLIDDDLAVRDSTELLLGMGGIDVRTYASANDFLNDASSTGLRCLVIDMNIPGMSGIELLDRLRSAGITTPAVFTTGRGSTAELRAAAARTGAHVVLKPYQPEELIEQIRAALYRS